MRADLELAMFSECFPCNPIPFAQGLADYVREQKRGDAIKDDTAKRILWILMGQAFGQMATIDLCDLWDEQFKKAKAEGKEV